MTSKRFVYQDQEWEASWDGLGVGVATGFEAQANSFSFTFRCLSDPGQPSVRGHLRDSDPYALSDEDFIRALKKAQAERR